MPDREKIIAQLMADMDIAKLTGESLVHITRETVMDTLALLREQEKPDCEHAEHDGIGCLGYAGCTQDDEPIVACKTCRKYTGNRCEEVIMDD